MQIYFNINDNSKIQFVSKQTHFQKANVNGKLVMVKLKEDILKFKYIESIVKKGEVEFKESEWERLVKQNMFVKI